MPVSVEGVPPSAEVRARLAAEGRPVVLAFSRGKDSVAAWLALAEAGCEVVPVHYDLVPGLRFVEESLSYFERVFGVRIRRYPHASFWRWLCNYVFQPPERCGVIDAADPYPWTPETLVQRVVRIDPSVPCVRRWDVATPPAPEGPLVLVDDEDWEDAQGHLWVTLGRMGLGPTVVDVDHRGPTTRRVCLRCGAGREDSARGTRIVPGAWTEELGAVQGVR